MKAAYVENDCFAFFTDTHLVFFGATDLHVYGIQSLLGLVE